MEVVRWSLAITELLFIAALFAGLFYIYKNKRKYFAGCLIGLILFLVLIFIYIGMLTKAM